ncbi:unnamed protein product [Toxocara canis]|uniref:MAGE domain-containing protein n=1 Tax=Toxocara canis TaxID=6265 RepID=A0A183TVS8_TOXCA|nr:unnamed protein product [Toxocara canis]
MFGEDLRHAENEENPETSHVARRKVTGPSETAGIVVFGTSIDFQDIFARETKKSRHVGVSSLLKEEHGGSPLRIVEKKPHNGKLCFYCSWSEEIFGSKVGVGEQAVQSESRAVLLSVVQLMESKHISPEKKLIKMYSGHPELFSSPCVYADVVEILSQYRYRLGTRRFLQELFVDVFYSFADHVMC